MVVNVNKTGKGEVHITDSPGTAAIKLLQVMNLLLFYLLIIKPTISTKKKHNVL